MARTPSVSIDPAAVKAAKARVTKARKERAAKRREKHSKLAERLARLRYFAGVRRKEARDAQRRIGSALRSAVTQTAYDAKTAEKAPDGHRFCAEECANRPLRVIVECAKALDPKQVADLIRQALRLDNRQTSPEVGYLFPRLARRSKDLARYMIVDLHVNRRRGMRLAPRICDAIRRAGPFLSVRSEGLRSGVASGAAPDTTGPNYVMSTPTHRDWHLTDPEQALFDDRHYGGAVDLYGAWEALGAAAGQNGAGAGQGIVIGHPDTGYRPHEDYPVAQVDEDRAFNAFENLTASDYLAQGLTGIAYHPFEPRTFPYYVQHGTFTASVIAAPRSDPAANEMVGVAPGATILPLRCVDTVILAGDLEIVRAIDYAVHADVDVISISLGGSPNPALLDALRYAIGNGTIVVAASGQPGPASWLPSQVVAPAAWAEVIAVGGSIGPRAWHGCFSGPEVDFCAPAVEIRHASFSTEGDPGHATSQGTSFATAITAGVAALWLQHHGGRAAIRQAVPGVTVQQVFRHLARETAYNPLEFPDGSAIDLWRGDLYGSGILHARRLLEANLPDPRDVPGFKRFQPPNAYVIGSGIAIVDLNGRPVLDGIIMLQNAPGAIASGLAGAGQVVGDFISDLVTGTSVGSNAFATNWLGSLGALQSFGVSAFSASGLASAWENALAAAGSVSGEVGAWLEEEAKKAEEAWNEAEDAIDEALDEASDTVEEFIDETSDFLEEAADDASETGSEIVEDVVDAFSSLFG